MRLGKRAGSAVLAFTLAFSMMGGNGILLPAVPEGKTVQAAGAGETGSTEVPEGINSIDQMVIADTYYTVNGEIPLMVEWHSRTGVTYDQYENLKLTVTKEDGTLVAEKTGSDSYYGEKLGLMQVSGCRSVEAGKSYSLKFALSDTLSGKEILTETKTVAFEEKDEWADCAYLPTGTGYSLTLNVATGAALGADKIDGICLLDKNGRVAADSKDATVNEVSGNDNRYESFHTGISHRGWSYARIDAYLYRTRKLEAGEVLQAAYIMDGEVIPTECRLTVTDQPYITGIWSSSSFYSGEESTETCWVIGRNIDFDKLSFVLKDRITGEEVGRSVSSVTDHRDGAYYAVKWQEGYQEKSPVACKVEYEYSDASTKVIAEQGDYMFLRDEDTEDVLWNPKTDAIEYHNSRIPAGASVSYEVRRSYYDETVIASGSGIIADKQHYMEIPLKETFDYTGSAYLEVIYTDAEGVEQKEGTYLDVHQNKAAAGSGTVWADYCYSWGLNPMYYLSGGPCAFSAELRCSDESMLAATASAVICKREDDSEVAEVTLSKKKLSDNEFTYQETWEKGLPAGGYRLKFKPNTENNFSYDFYVQDKDTMGLYRMEEFISSDSIELHFGSKEIANWYCSEENQKKLAVHLFDIHGKEIAVYSQKDGDFYVEDTMASWGISGTYSSTGKRIVFSEKAKKELDSIYYCTVSVFYDGKEAVQAEDPTINIRREFIRSEGSSGWISMSYHPEVYCYDKGKYTYSRISGSESAFPAVLTVTDWYSIKPIKNITVKKSGYVLTGKDLEGLSADKVYGYYLKGADGSVDSGEAYLSDESEYNYHNPWWTSFSDCYRVSGDFDVTLTFLNKSDATANAHNYCVGFANAFTKTSAVPSDNEGYREYYLLRSDCWGWSPAGTNITQEGNPVTYTSDWNWDQFKEMMRDAKVTMNIKRTGNDFVVDAKILGADKKTYSYVTKFTTNADKDMTLFLTSEYAEVSNVVFKNNQETQKPSEETPEPEKPSEETPGEDTGNSGTNSGNTGTDHSGNTGANTNTGGNTVNPQPETTKPAEETKKEDPKPEETPAEDTKKEETKEPEKETEKEPEKEEQTEETKKPSKDKTGNSKKKGKLTLKKTKIVISKGQKAKIKITSTVNTKVTYRSLNKKIAAVNSKGIVTAKKKGKAVIMVKANGKKKKVTVTVKGGSGSDGKSIELDEDFSLSDSKAVLKKGTKLTVQKASGLSGKVAFRSLNKKIASVSSKGVIKARKKGKTTILIKNRKKTIKLKITVKI